MHVNYFEIRLNTLKITILEKQMTANSGEKCKDRPHSFLTVVQICATTKEVSL